VSVEFVRRTTKCRARDVATETPRIPAADAGDDDAGSEAQLEDGLHNDWRPFARLRRSGRCQDDAATNTGELLLVDVGSRKSAGREI
jgi:hypothetical protein